MTWRCLALLVVGCSASGGLDSAGRTDADAAETTSLDDASSDAIFPVEESGIDASSGKDASDGCVPSTVKCSFPNCNTSSGADEAECLKAGNPGGCERSGDYGDVFKAWCTRRVGTGSAWQDVRRGFVEKNCGSAKLVDGNYIGYLGCKTCICSD